MTLTYELALIYQRSFRSKVIVRTHIHAHTQLIVQGRSSDIWRDVRAKLSSNSELDVTHVVRIKRRRRTDVIQFSSPRLEESCEFCSSRSGLGAGVPAASEYVAVAMVRGAAVVGDGGRRPADGRATAAQRRRRVGPVVVGDDGEDDGVPVATGVRRRPTAQLPQRHAERVDVGRRRHRAAAEQLRCPVGERAVKCRRVGSPRWPLDRRPRRLVRWQAL